MRRRKVTLALTTAWRRMVSRYQSWGMLIEVKTSRSGRHLMVVPVRSSSLGSISSAFFLAPTTLPFLKCREYLLPSRQTVTSMYSEAYWVAHEPRPLVPSEKS